MKNENPVSIYNKKLESIMLQEQNYTRLIKLAPKHINFDTIMEAVKMEICLNPELSKCSLKSVMYATMECARLGLIPSQSLGRAWIIPFKKNIKGEDGKWESHSEATFILGYKGMIDLIYRHPAVDKLQLGVVYKDDYFEDDGYGRIKHIVNEETPPNFIEVSDKRIRDKFHITRYIDPNYVRAVYFRIWLKGCNNPLEGYHVKWQIEKKRDDSIFPSSPAWQYRFDKMALKALLRDQYNQLPTSTEFVNLPKIRDEQPVIDIYESEISDDVVDITAATNSNKKNGLGEKIKSKRVEKTNTINEEQESQELSSQLDDIFGEDV